MAVYIIIDGNRAQVRVLGEALTGATGVTVVGGNALVLIERARAVSIPYSPKAP